MLGLYVTGLVLALATTAFLYLRSKFSYWQRRKVPGPAPVVPFGNFLNTVMMGKKGMGMALDDFYRQYKSERYIGTYFLFTPLLHIHDPEIIRQVFIKEFQDFNGRGMYSDPEADPLSGHLFQLAGTPWRNMRVKLSPTFTSGKIKFMFNTIRECAKFVTEHLDTSMKANNGSYVEDVRELVARFSTDVISSVAFGIESNSMKDPDSEFRRMGQRALGPGVEMGIRTMLTFFNKDIMAFFKISSSPRDVNKFFMRIVKEMVEYREKNNVERADMLNLLIQLKNKGFVPPDTDSQSKAEVTDAQLEKITMEQMVAQVFVFFLAGFETTSSTTSFTLFELAKDLEVQEKVIQEIDEVLKKHNGQLTYEAIMDLPYTDMVLQETMRIYPAVPFLTREAMVERELPLTDLTLEKGTRLMIPVYSLHMDPQYWPEPHKYDPMRFTEEAKRTRPSMVYMPFGDGPRICIGMRFGLVQAKMGLVTILSRCRVALAPGTPRELPLSPLSVIPTPLDGVKLTLSKR